MKAFKLLKSRNKLFIQVRYITAFISVNANPTSTLLQICCGSWREPCSLSEDLSVLCWMGEGPVGAGFPKCLPGGAQPEMKRSSLFIQCPWPSDQNGPSLSSSGGWGGKSYY